MTIATDIANAFNNEPTRLTAKTREIVGPPGSAFYIHAGDALAETLAAFGECPGASCHATAAELCGGVSRWVFDDGSEITTAIGGRWQVVAVAHAMPQTTTPPTLSDIVDQIESLLDDAAALSAPHVAGHLHGVLHYLTSAAHERAIGIESRLRGAITRAVEYEQHAERSTASARALLAK